MCLLLVLMNKEKLVNLMVAILRHYPEGLSPKDLQRVMYLYDIEHVKKYGEQFTDIQWNRGNL